MPAYYRTTDPGDTFSVTVNGTGYTITSAGTVVADADIPPLLARAAQYNIVLLPGQGGVPPYNPYAAAYAADLNAAVALAPPPSGGDDYPVLAALIPSVSGRVQLRQGTYRISGNLNLPEGVSLLAAGGGFTNPGTTLLCTAAGAGLTITGAGGLTGQFLVDGNRIATNPLRRTGGAHRTLIDVTVDNAAQDGWITLASQNDLWLGCNVQNSARDNMVFDQGAGGIAATRLELNAAGRYGMRFDTQVSGGPYAAPTHLTFHHLIVERSNPYSGVGTSLIKILAGDLLSFHDPNIFGDPSMSGPHVDIATGAVVNWYDGQVIGTVTTANTGFAIANGAAVRFVGEPRLVGLLNGLSLAAGNPNVSVAGRLIFSGVANRYAGAGLQDSSVLHYSDHPLFMTRETVADKAWAAQVRGDSGLRAWMTSDGVIHLGDGTSYSTDRAAVSGKTFRPPAYTTTARNALTGLSAADTVYDTTLGYLVSWNGSAWRNQAGTTV